MKILNRYILKEHFGPFFFSLSVIMFILLMQFLVKFIDKIFGKGLSVLTILELITYNLAWMAALAVPMATLVAVLMAFGRFSADNEITILKSSGISIYRIIRPSLFFGIMLTVIMIYFNDQVLPDTNHAARKMMQAIKRKKPTLALQEHIFTEIGLFAFVVKKIEKPLPDEWLNMSSMLGPEYASGTPDRLRYVTIFDKSSQNSTKTINAEEGYMVYSKEKRALIFTLFRGEFHEFDFTKVEEYQRSDFEKHIVYIPASNFELEESNSSYRSDREMNIARMQEEVAKSQKQIDRQHELVEKDINLNFREIFKLLTLIEEDSLNRFASLDSTSAASEINPHITKRKALRMVDQRAQKMKTHLNLIDNQKGRINKFEVEIYKKLSIPFASIIFVLVGAPLGIMARKGSMGVAISLSLGFFVLYWAFLIGGEKLADRQILSPFWSMWAPNVLIFSAGIYLIWRAVRESSFINWDKLFKLFKSKSDQTAAQT